MHEKHSWKESKHVPASLTQPQSPHHRLCLPFGQSIVQAVQVTRASNDLGHTQADQLHNCDGLSKLAQPLPSCHTPDDVMILSDLDAAGACVVIVPAECSVEKVRTSTGTQELQEGNKKVNTLWRACRAPCTACLSTLRYLQSMQ